MNRCNSDTDGIVRMEKGVMAFLRATPLAARFIFPSCLPLEGKVAA